MKEFDLKKYLAEGRLLKEEEKEVSDKARREAEEEGYEDGYNDAVEDAKDALDKIKDETEEEKDKKKGVKEEMKDKSMEDDTMKEEMDDTINPGNTKDDQAKKDAYDYDARPAHMKEEEMKDKKEKLTKEGLRNLIKEKITSILTEDEEVEDNVDVNVEKDVDVNVKDKEEVDVDKESEESDIEVKSELPGESSDTSAVLGLLTKAQEEAEGMNDEVLMDQIGNTITYFTRKHVVKASNEKLEEAVNELFGFFNKNKKMQWYLLNRHPRKQNSYVGSFARQLKGPKDGSDKKGAEKALKQHVGSTGEAAVAVLAKPGGFSFGGDKTWPEIEKMDGVEDVLVQLN